MILKVNQDSSNEVSNDGSGTIYLEINQSIVEINFNSVVDFNHTPAEYEVYGGQTFTFVQESFEVGEVRNITYKVGSFYDLETGEEVNAFDVSEFHKDILVAVDEFVSLSDLEPVPYEYEY